MFLQLYYDMYFLSFFTGGMGGGHGASFSFGGGPGGGGTFFQFGWICQEKHNIWYWWEKRKTYPVFRCLVSLCNF